MSSAPRPSRPPGGGPPRPSAANIGATPKRPRQPSLSQSPIHVEDDDGSVDTHAQLEVPPPTATGGPTDEIDALPIDDEFKASLRAMDADTRREVINDIIRSEQISSAVLAIPEDESRGEQSDPEDRGNHAGSERDGSSTSSEEEDHGPLNRPDPSDTEQTAEMSFLNALQMLLHQFHGTGMGGMRHRGALLILRYF